MILLAIMLCCSAKYNYLLYAQIPKAYRNFSASWKTNWKKKLHLCHFQARMKAMIG